MTSCPEAVSFKVSVLNFQVPCLCVYIYQVVLIPVCTMRLVFVSSLDSLYLTVLQTLILFMELFYFYNKFLATCLYFKQKEKERVWIWDSGNVRRIWEKLVNEETVTWIHQMRKICFQLKYLKKKFRQSEE